MNPQQQALCSLLGISYPLVQAGMVWVSGAKLAAASANAGILGVVGAGSMDKDCLRAHLRKAKTLTSKPIAVNIPLLYRGVEEQINIAWEEGISIFITSAGSPKVWTPRLKANGGKVLHVVSSPVLAKKSEDAGVDGVICEGFEAGGHNGRDELTTFVLIPQVVQAVKIPVIAAGGIATGGGVAAALALGASGAQLGTRFAATVESSAHDAFKQRIVQAKAEDTELCMKALVPVRLLKNAFYHQVKALENRGASSEELSTLLGKGRARQGMHFGDLEEGELEIGQISGLIQDIPTVQEVVSRLLQEYNEACAHLRPWS